MNEGFDAEAFRRRTNVSRETLDRFETWRRRLEDRNAVVNLVGKSTLPEFWVRHALDSWQIYERAPDKPRWLDIGAGAGFPGLARDLLSSDPGRPFFTAETGKVTRI